MTRRLDDLLPCCCCPPPPLEDVGPYSAGQNKLARHLTLIPKQQHSLKDYLNPAARCQGSTFLSPPFNFWAVELVCRACSGGYAASSLVPKEDGCLIRCCWLELRMMHSKQIATLGEYPRGQVEIRD